MNHSRPPAYWLYPIGLILAMCVSALPGQWPLVGVLAIGVALFGLPHGSLDIALAQHFLKIEKPMHLAGFIIGYLTLGGLVVAVWWQAPTHALTAFLLYSALHFGDDVAPRLGRLGATGYGLWLLAIPLTLQPYQVLPLFEALGAAKAQDLITAAPWALGLGGILMTTAILTKSERATSDWRDPLLFLAAGAILHPLAYFIAYFCFLHSPRHLTLAAQNLGLTGWRHLLKKTLPTTLATYVLVMTSIPFLLHLPTDALLLRLVFITLAALTVPHIILGQFIHFFSDHSRTLQN